MRLSQSRKAYFPLQTPIYSLLLSPFCGTIPVEIVSFNKCVTSEQLSVTSCKFPHYSHNFYVSLPFQFYIKKSPSVYFSERDLTTIYHSDISSIKRISLNSLFLLAKLLNAHNHSTNNKCYKDNACHNCTLSYFPSNKNSSWTICSSDDTYGRRFLI